MAISTTIGAYFNLHVLWLSIWESESPDLKRERHTRLHRKSDRRRLHRWWSERCRLHPCTTFVTRNRRLSSASSICIPLRRAWQYGDGSDGNSRMVTRSGSLSWLHLIPSGPRRPSSACGSVQFKHYATMTLCIFVRLHPLKTTIRLRICLNKW